MMTDEEIIAAARKLQAAKKALRDAEAVHDALKDDFDKREHAASIVTCAAREAVRVAWEVLSNGIRPEAP